jgi:hypothetical protein
MLAGAKTCGYGGPGIDDGCAVLQAAGHIGLYTVSNVNGSSLWNYGRQTGQAAYHDALGALSAHPAPFNVPGEDYGLGPWSSSLTLVNSSTASSISMPTGCAYQSAYHYYRCTLTSTQFTGSISGGVVTTDGTALTVGNYIYSGVYGSTYAPYKITASLGGNQYALATTPDLVTGAYIGGAWVQQTTAPDRSSQTFYTSVKTTISGYDFDDVGFYFGNGAAYSTGYVDIENNTFRIGAYECAGLNGVGPIRGQWINTPIKVYSNYFGNDATCSGSAFRFPASGGGAVQKMFNATIIDAGGGTGTVMQVTSASSTYPSFGQYLDYNGTISGDTAITSGVPAQIGAVVAPGTSPCPTGTATCFILSSPETAGSYTLSTGPILSRLGEDIADAAGAGMVDVEYNYSDKLSALTVNSNIGADYIEHNYIELVGPPATHANSIYHGIVPPATTPKTDFGVSFTGDTGGGGTTLTVDSSYTGYAGNTPQVGWRVSTANNSQDHTFTTATITAISGTTITLDTSEPALSGLTFYSGKVYTVPYEIHSNNVVVNNTNSSAGVNYGWETPGYGPNYLPYYGGGTLVSGVGKFAQGSGDADSTFVTTYGSGNTAPADGEQHGYYGLTLYDEVNNSITITNTSNGNTTNTSGTLTSAAIRFLSQGSGFTGLSGPYPGTVAAASASGNFIDPHGAFGCVTINEPGVYTGPANGVRLSYLIFTGNIDLLDGTTADIGPCSGHR